MEMWRFVSASHSPKTDRVRGLSIGGSGEHVTILFGFHAISLHKERVRLVQKMHRLVESVWFGQNFEKDELWASKIHWALGRGMKILRMCNFH